MTRRVLFCAALLWLAAARAAGQDGGEAGGVAAAARARSEEAGAEAARLLKSPGNVGRAWGAYLAGLHGLKEKAPLLAGLLDDPALAGGGPEEAYVRRAALDALIRLDAEVPAESLLPHYRSSPDEVVILLARSPQRNWPALLSLFEGEMPARRWLAVGNLLAAARAPGFAARLLRELRFEASVNVYDDAGERDINGGGSGGCGCGGDDAGDFPPVAYYQLTAEAARGATVVAAGRRTVYYVRTPSASFCADCETFHERDVLRVEYVAELLRTTEDEIKLDARPHREVVCEDARRCRRAAADVRDEITRAYTSAVARLLEDGLLDAAEAAELSAPDLTLKLTDYRSRKPFPLPDRLRGAKVIIEGGEEAPFCCGDRPPPARSDAPPAP